MADVFDELSEINTPVVIKDGKIQRINFRPFLDALYDRFSTKPILRTRNILEFMSSLQGKNKSSVVSSSATKSIKSGFAPFKISISSMTVGEITFKAGNVFQTFSKSAI